MPKRRYKVKGVLNLRLKPPDTVDEVVQDRKRSSAIEEANRLAWEKTYNPEYYAQYEIEPLEFILKNKLSFAQGNIIKYVVRYKDKNGLEDLLKAKVYLEKLIQEYS